MRTTLTIDDDLAVRIERLRRERGYPLKSIVNEALRAGLEHLERPPDRPRRYRIQPAFLEPRTTNLDDVAEVLATYEGEGFP